MRYLTIFVALLIVVGCGWYWWSVQQTVDSEQEEKQIESVGTEGSTSTETVNIYQNNEWGISFEYPLDWEIREPAFGSTVSLFNFAIEPIDPFRIKAITFNLFNKAWGISAIEKMKNDGIVFEDQKVKGYDALYFESSYEGTPQLDYMILVNDTYWVNVAGKKEYESVLTQVLESLEITPVAIE